MTSRFRLTAKTFAIALAAVAMVQALPAPPTLPPAGAGRLMLTVDLLDS